MYQTHDHASSGHVTLVASAARHLADKSDTELIDLAVAELKLLFPVANDATLRHSKVIREHTATFTLALDALPPGPDTTHPGLFIAGDWTDTGLPATIESAVRSGYTAADRVIGI